jgi:hypothetical protein
MKLRIKLAVAAFASAALFALPAMSAPLSAFPNGVSVGSRRSRQRPPRHRSSRRSGL